MHKRWLAAVSALLLLFSAGACGTPEQQTPTDPAPTQTTTVSTVQQQADGDIAVPDAAPAQSQSQQTPQSPTAQTEVEKGTQAESQSALGPLFLQYVRTPVSRGVYSIKFQQAGMSIYTTVDGDNSVLESNAAGLLHITLINRDGNYYMLMHNTQKYTEMSAEDYAEQASTMKTLSLETDSMTLQKTGEATVAGKKYTTETYDEGSSGVVTYYFDDTGLRRARVVKNGKTSEIDRFEVSGTVEPSVFEIPDGYTLVSDPGQLFS